jgi:hypothetical protein
MILPDWIVLYMAIVGGGLLIVGVRKAGIALISPAAFRWLVFPLLKPELQQLPIFLIVAAIPIIAIFGGILALDRVVSAVYGPRAGGHVTGTYLVRVFDAIGGGLVRMMLLPVKFAARLLRRQ